MRWAFQIQPLADELLSGYLCRVAFAHGASPYGFYALHFGDSAWWARDIDRGVVRRHDSTIADQAGISVEQIRSLTLRDWLERLTPSTYLSSQPAAVTPWINAVSVFHRMRRQHALQFCSQCLQESGVVQKQWRVSFVVLCPRHRVELQDGCPRCDAPFIPHRAVRRMYRCHVCHESLTEQPSRAHSSMDASNPLLQFQSQLLTGLAMPNVPDPATHKRMDLLGLRQLISALFTEPYAMRAYEFLGVSGFQVAKPHPRMELARHSHRMQALAGCHALMADWPKSFRSLSETLNITQRRFSLQSPWSAWLADEVARLPTGTVRSSYLKSPGLQAELAQLHEDRPLNWRAARARIMICGAKRTK